MPEVAEQLKCRCGLPMEETPSGKGYYCRNCDTTQPQERGIDPTVEKRLFSFELIPVAQGRRKTKQDIRYDMYWLAVINTEYDDNTKSSDKSEGGDDG